MVVKRWINSVTWIAFAILILFVVYFILETFVVLAMMGYYADAGLLLFILLLPVLTLFLLINSQILKWIIYKLCRKYINNMKAEE